MRQRFLHTVSMLYAQYGIKGVTMTQLASSLGISKKTLYNEFGDKERLLDLCIQNEVDQLNRRMDEQEKEATNTVECFFSICFELFDYFSSYSPAFYKDVKRYVEAHFLLIEFLTDLKKRFANFFQQGIHDGLFLPEGNYDLLSVVFAKYIGPAETRPSWSLLATCLRGVCTKQGIKELERVQQNYPIF